MKNLDSTLFEYTLQRIYRGERSERKDKSAPLPVTALFSYFSNFTYSINKRSYSLDDRYSYHEHAKTITSLIYNEIRFVFAFIYIGIYLNVGGNTITENRIFEKK